MVGYYKTWASIILIIVANLAVKLFEIPVTGNLLLGNHLVEAFSALALVALLVDLKIINGKLQRNYIKIGLIALGVGIVMSAASFSSLFVMSEFKIIATAWIKIAPQLIFLIGLPSLYMADKLSQKHKLWGINNVGAAGLRNLFILIIGYALVALYLLNKYGLLII